MIILNAKFPAGMSIEDAIADALEFSDRNNCMLACDINGVEVPVVAGIIPKDVALRQYRVMYDMLIKNKEKNND